MDTTVQITRHRDADGRTVRAVRGEVDAASAPFLRSAIMAELSHHALVLDVTSAVLIDSAGLHALTAAQREAAALGRPPIVLRGVRPLLAKNLKASGLAETFPREPAPALTPRSLHRLRRPHEAAPVPARDLVAADSAA
ncbi:STAS domain-containing protein [Streptacidiphilus neutrinimicus]|uniref:STAS domain-containing protein n=1 Tax=Streptacidiphilus neutrinimicus TaxID=105420 RepID=UPI0006943CCF|nr:STAS domain-containing protein [Streptacidiphilus neutrinimicus]